MSKVISLSEATSVGDNDLVYVVVDPSGTPLDKKVKISNLVNSAVAYAEIHTHDNSTTQSIANGTTYTKCTLFNSAGIAANATVDLPNDKITITKAGKYKVSGSFSMTSGTNNTTIFGTAFLGGVEQDNIHFERKIGTANDKGNASFTGFIDASTVPVDLDFRVRHDVGTTVNLTLFYGNLNISYLGK